MKVKRQYLYHITEENWGETITLSPRSYGDNRSYDEPNTPRICCAPSIECCLIAIPVADLETVNIYRTWDKVESEKPCRVLDAHITGERWITKPTDFIFIKNLNDVRERFKEQFKEPKDKWLLIGGKDIESRRWQIKTKAILKEFLTSH